MAALDGLKNDRENSAPQSHINAMRKNTDLFNLIAQLQQKVDTLSSQLKNTPNTTTTIYINPETGKSYKRYCWTFGCCNHWGRNYPGPKATSHRDGTTFKDRMGSSNKHCLGPKTWMVGGVENSNQIIRLKFLINFYLTLNLIL